MSVVAPHLDRIIALVKGGMLVTEALATNAEFPKYATLMAHLRKHPADRARLDSAKRRDVLRGTAKYFDQIVELVRGGMQIKAACESNPEFPSYTTFKKFYQMRPAYRARLDAARNLDVGEVLVRRHWDKFIAAIEAGGAIIATCERFGFTSGPLYRLLDLEPDMQSRFDAAIVTRESGPNALGQGRHSGPKASWETSDFDKAIEVLTTSKAASIYAALEPPLMPKHTVFAWASRDPERMRRLRHALAVRPRPGRYTDDEYEAALEVIRTTKTGKYEKALVAAGAPPRWAVQKMKRDAAFKARFNQAMNISRSKRRVPRPVYGYAMLQTGLAQNEIYRAARSAIPAKIDPIMRDDMISEIVIAVMEGRLQPDQILSRGFEIGREFERRNNSHEFLSAELSFNDGSEDTTSRYDRVGLAEWSFEGAI